ncbi:Osmotically-inducible protein Y precursor [Mariniflexile rhizosphaerae]|uniref:BON domain-containing protein n=1 Tax=unclassified Mariniflexile TaxID=2643887 RepID=UPI000CB68295|nr:BON domain-containing protein [Mariniflexile sp. TRM1-10]AXP82290.1 Osmotically-inducible protein Y precursor [Mariniflexile sp. TRM1-10]PLB20388.1 MAG: Osmotically inducible protein Y precursor [Flavobacteriaceae bacterium FS1-H7996/R]
MKTDVEIRNDVLDELAWQPAIDETEIGVTVEKGVVTLTGTVDSYAKKIAAEKAAKSVKGVRAVAEDIEVKYGTEYKKSDKEIAKAAADALKWNYSVPDDKVQIKVDNGWIYLSGEVKWEYQKDAAKSAVENLLGVRGVSNSITLKQSIEPYQVKEKIKKALERSAEIEAQNINVIVDGHKVKLRGKVHSWTEKEEVRRAAYLAPGVYEVDNELEVTY